MGDKELKIAGVVYFYRFRDSIVSSISLFSLGVQEMVSSKVN